MNEFVRNPSSSARGTKISIGVPTMTPNCSRRRSTSASFGTKPDFGPPILSYSTPQPIRRYSNPIGSSSSGFCSYSPNESCNQSFEMKSRRYSQPSSPSAYSTNVSPLVRQEKESYSSLSFLPEVQTYLQFIEDSNTPPQRSNSFSGRNLSRRSSSSSGRQKVQSRSRTPSNNSGEGEEQETSFNQSQQSSNSFGQNNGPGPYGQYLMPTSGRSASLDTHHPPRQVSSIHQKIGKGNDAGVGRVFHSFSHHQQRTLQELSSPTNQKSPVFHRCFEHRRNSSTIRTSFI